SLAKIFVGVGVVRLDCKRTLIQGHSGLVVAQLALRVADHGQNHRVVLVLNRLQGRQRFDVTAGESQVASLPIEFLVIERRRFLALPGLTVPPLPGGATWRTRSTSAAAAATDCESVRSANRGDNNQCQQSKPSSHSNAPRNRGYAKRPVPR